MLCLSTSISWTYWNRHSVLKQPVKNWQIVLLPLDGRMESLLVFKCVFHWKSGCLLWLFGFKCFIWKSRCFNNLQINPVRWTLFVFVILYLILFWTIMRGFTFLEPQMGTLRQANITVWLPIFGMINSTGSVTFKDNYFQICILVSVRKRESYKRTVTEPLRCFFWNILFSKIRKANLWVGRWCG